jgi:hypothetical protein
MPRCLPPGCLQRPKMRCALPPPPAIRSCHG